MNKHIELVKKWLDDPTSVTQQELEDNRNAAAAFYATADYAYAGDDVNAEYWANRYEELKEKDE
jgi:hypothetical protein